MQSSTLFAWIAIALCVLALRIDSQEHTALALAPGDQVRITVENSPRYTTEGMLEDDGSIAFPELGRVRLGGLDRLMAEGYIATRLQQESAIAAAQVHVQVLQEPALRLAELSADSGTTQLH